MGLESGTDWLDYCASALIVDLDNDGDRDLVVAQEWRILLMSNDGKGRFQLEFGTSSEAQSFSLSAADYDLDGDLDVYRVRLQSSRLQRTPGSDGRTHAVPRRQQRWPEHAAAQRRQLAFTDVTSEVGLNQNNSRFSFAAAWEDYDNDGDPDLYVANDYGRNNLYRNDRALRRRGARAGRRRHVRRHVRQLGRTSIATA